MTNSANTPGPQKQTVLNLLLRVFRNLSPRRRAQFYLLTALSVVAAFAELASIGAVIPFLALLTDPVAVLKHPAARSFANWLGITQGRPMMFAITAIFCIAAATSGAIRLLLYWAQAGFSNSVGVEISDGVFRRTVYQPYLVHLSRNSSEVIAAATGKANQVVYGALMPASLIMGSSTILLIVVAALIAYQPLVAITAVGGFGALYSAILVGTRGRLRDYSGRISREQGVMTQIVQETIMGIRDVLLDGTQEVYCRLFRDASISFRRASASVQALGVSPRYLMESLGMVLIAAMAYTLAGSGSGLQGAIPVLGAFALGAQRMLPNLQQVFFNITTIRSSHDSISDALDLLEQPLPRVQRFEAAAPLPFDREICLDSVAFKYGPDLPWVLQDINLRIPKGARIGLIGTTGSGKSSLLDILMGLLQPSEGLLRIDDEVISASNLRAWQAQLAHVPQSIFLADVSVAENIAFGQHPSQIDMERVRKAAGQAQIAQTIESWPQGYRTRVGERGLRLSGGQRQRIGIARALYKRARVLVLDEATSALDTRTENAVMDAMQSLGRDLTVLMVAHRLTTLRGCDTIIELEHGRLKRSGSYDDIVEQA